MTIGFKIATGEKMRPYQVRAAHQIFTGTPVRDKTSGAYIGPDLDGTMVHVDMGLGKTVTALTAIADWYRFGVLVRPTLVVAPIKVCQTVWAQEAKLWSHTHWLSFSKVLGNVKDRAFALAPGRGTLPAYTAELGRHSLAHVYLINPENLKWLHNWLRQDWSFFDALIIDDVALKDPKTQQFKILSNYGVRRKCPLTGKMTRLAPHRFKRSAKMTGTPSPNGLLNIWSPAYLMDHGARIHSDYETYRDRFFHKTKEVADHVWEYEINSGEAESRPVWQIRETAYADRIHELIADVTVELNAEDYGVLPKVIGDASKGNLEELGNHVYAPTHVHRVELPDDIRPKYDQLERDAIIELTKDTVMAQNGGAKSMMCWQIANGALYRTDDFGNKEAEELHTRKLDKLVELVDTIDSNVIVPYYFQHDYARIVERLKREGMAFASLKGKNTERIIDQWNGGYTPILLLHPQSAGHGLNLQFGGHHMIWFTLLWSLERYLQTLARLARSGQKYIVQNHHIVTSRTTDELMLSNLRQNGNDQQRFRAALREYQQIRGMGLYSTNVLEGLL